MDAHMHDAENLLADTRWMQSLARGLLGETPAAEDATQEVWRALHERGEIADRSRGSLGRLVRTFARRFRRREARLHARELRAARSEAVPSTDELVERLELQRIVAEELATLREPLRTTLLLRYHAGLDAAEIARRHGLEHGAVRKRIERGLAELRERLDRRVSGGRDAWCALLLPIVRDETVVVAKGAMLAASIALIVIAIGVAGAWSWSERVGASSTASSDERAVATPSTGRLGEAEVADPAAVPPVERRRSELATSPLAGSHAAEEGSGAAAALASSTDVSVRVVGPDAAPVAGARVELFHATRTAPPKADALPLDTARTDANGCAVVRATCAWRELTLAAKRDGVGASGLVGLAGSGVKDGEPVELVLRPNAQVVVVVLDASGAPLRGEHVTLRQRGLLIGGPNPRAVPDGTTDAQGRATFEVHGVRATWIAGVATSAGDTDAVEFTLPLASDAPIPLRPKATFVIEGRARGFGDAPASDRIVSAWSARDAQVSASTRTTEDGSFVLHVEHARDWLVATAASDGFVRAPELVHIAEGERRARVELELVAPSSCAGVVRWDEGRPASGARVSACASSATSTDPRAAMLERFGLDTRETRTDGEGRFTLDGLHPDLVYVVAAGDDDREPRRFVLREGVLPGARGLELVFSERALRKGWVRGRVVDSTTNAAPSVYELELYQRNSDEVWWPLNVRPVVEASGAFVLQGLEPGREYALSACFLDRVLRTQPRRFVADDEHGTDLELAVPPPAELVVEVRGASTGEPRMELVVRATTLPVVLASVPVDARHATTHVRGLHAGRVRVELRAGKTTLDSTEIDLHAGANSGASIHEIR